MMGQLKALLVLVFAFTISVKAVFIDHSINENCLKEFGLSESYYMSVLNQNTKDANNDVKCVTKCIFKGYKILKEDGTLDMEQLVEGMFHPWQHFSTQVSETCIKNEAKSGVMDCETVYNIVVCIHKSIDEIKAKINE